ncbi:MAG: OB-fold protein [Sediminibacterium sp.]
MKKWTKIILTLVLVGAVTGGIIVYKIFTKPHRDVTTEKAIAIKAQALFEAFKNDEAAANTKYLDKAIEIEGEVLDQSTNQDGQSVVNFKTDDAFFVINCTFKTNPGELKPGTTIRFKGICTGYIPDANVVINEGVLVK